MRLFRVHAYAVSPHRTASGHFDEPRGGAIRITPQLRTALEETTIAADFERQTLIDFEVDLNSRTNDTRNYILDFGFGEPAVARNAAIGLARRLAQAMDKRSTSCLLVLAALRRDDHRTVTVWTFPQDQAFRLQSSRREASIQVLTDIFSQTSRLRKAALFQGRNLKSEFLQGRALDSQANQVSQDLADFWIRRFLQCTFSLRGDAGTRMIAKMIRKAVEACAEIQDKEQLLVAVMAIRTSPRRRWSVDEFANSYLTGEAKDKFLDSLPNERSRPAMFDFERNLFESVLQFRVFALESGVWVSSPFGEIDKSVKITGDVERHLHCEGVVVAEKVRARHA